MAKKKFIKNSRCVCGKVAFYSVEAAEFHLGQAQRLSFVDSKRKEIRVYICEIAKPDPVWHLTSMTEAQHIRRTKVWLRATIWTCGVRGMPSIVLTEQQMRGRVASSPWTGKVSVKIVTRKRKL